MFRFALLNLMISSALVFGVQPASAEHRLALVIGQSAYRSVPALPNPANDAKAVTQMLTDSGFEVSTATDLSQNQMREQVSDFAGKVAASGADTVALVFYAGHGLQIDGENFLVPIDVDPKREADIPIQAVRLNDVLNTLTSVPSKMRILMLDACRNNPFPAINGSVGRGLAIVDAKTGSPNTFLSFSTSPGAEAEDGAGADSPYTAALLAAAKEPGLPIEETFKRVRLSVNKVTQGRQTPWDSSSLTEDFRFSGPPAAAGGSKPLPVKRTVEDWRRDLKGKPVEIAHDMIVADGTDAAYEAFVELYTQPPFAPQAREWLDRHRRLVAWNIAVITNTAAGYRGFLAQYPGGDLAATARKLEERLRYRPNFTPAIVAGATPQNVALAAPTCPCNTQPPLLKKVDAPVRRVDPDPPRRTDRRPPRQVIETEEEVVVVRRPPSREYFEPMPAPSIGIGIGVGGFGGGGGNYGNGPIGQGRPRGAY